MRLRTKLVLATTAFITVLTAVLCAVFFSELLRGRISQAQSANEVLVNEVLLGTRSAVQQGLATKPPAGPGEQAFEEAVTAALQTDAALDQTMNAITLYSPTVQDVYVSGANGQVLVSSDPTLLGAKPPVRRGFNELVGSSVPKQWIAVFGKPQIFDMALPLRRNGGPFLYAHIGVRSSLLRNALAPWLREAMAVAIVALLCAILAAATLSSAALHPIEQISKRLEALSARSGAVSATSPEQDAVQRVTSSINLIDQQIRVSAEQNTELASNLSQMLQTLRDGVMLLTADGVIAMASESLTNFLPADRTAIAGRSVFDSFPAITSIGSLLTDALTTRAPLSGLPATLEDGRPVELSLDFPAGSAGSRGVLGAMLTLHDPAAQQEVEREIELSRRLASIGRLTAGVGHEVKNPINAMVLHLELLRGKLGTDTSGAGRHVEVLASEMARLDRVVQTLADFTRPIEPNLREQALRPLVDSVLQLVSVDAQLRGVEVVVVDHARSARVVADSGMLHQALLNVVLNAMEAMPHGGTLQLHLRRERNMATIAIRDSGFGIPADMLEKVFHLYFTTKPTGSGIGLAMTWRTIQMLGGTIAVQSNADPDALDRGTLFTVLLPLSSEPVHHTDIPTEVHA